MVSYLYSYIDSLVMVLGWGLVPHEALSRIDCEHLLRGLAGFYSALSNMFIEFPTVLSGILSVFICDFMKKCKIYSQLEIVKISREHWLSHGV